MDSDQDFRELVRKSGIVFTTNVGQGPEEFVLAIATPTLAKAQVATQADLVAAGFVRAEGLRRLEVERDRLLELLAAADRQRQAMLAERQEREAVIRDLELRAAVAEAWKTGEQAGIVARNQQHPLDSNPHDGSAEAGPVEREAHQAWRHGWRLRDVLLDLNDRLKAALAAHVALEAAHQAQAAEAQADREARTRAEHETARRTHEAAELRLGLEAQLARARAQEEALRTIFAEAPHSPACALWTAAAATGEAAVVACNCWRSRLAAVNPLAP